LYTILGMLGKVMSNRLIFIKSNDELNPILVGLSSIRISIGLPLLKWYKTDNTASNRGLWTKYFPELKNNIVPPVLPNESLGYVLIRDENYLYITSNTSLLN